MAIRTKTQLLADINTDITTNGTGAITGSILNGLLQNMKDSWEDFIQSMTTVDRDALVAPDTRMLIFNTTLERFQLRFNATWNTIPLEIIQGNNFLNELILKGGSNTDLNLEEDDDWKVRVNGENFVLERREAGVFIEKFSQTP